MFSNNSMKRIAFAIARTVTQQHRRTFVSKVAAARSTVISTQRRNYQNDFDQAVEAEKHSSVGLVADETAATGDKPTESDEYSIKSFDLHPSLVDNLVNNFGINHLFPIQAKVMAPIKAGRDVIGKSKTGTGKTLAFLLPLIDAIVSTGYAPPAPGTTSILIMEPTRELANQVARELEKLDPRIRVATLYGGTPYGPQVNTLSRGVHVVVATPGRLMDHLNNNVLTLNQCNHVILDEADEMLRVGFAEAVDSILQGSAKDRQTVLFSATMPKWIAGLAAKHCKNYVYIDCAIDVEGNVTPDLITHKACMMPRDRSNVASVILSLMKSFSPNSRCMIFADTKAFVSEVEGLLNQEMLRQSQGRIKQYAGALHGDVSQSSRETILARFRSGSLQTLVATDVAARGIDVPDVDLVIQLGIPNALESYVHRSGRTGRAGKKGTCVLMYKGDQRSEMSALSSATKIRFSQVLASDVRDEGIPELTKAKVVRQINSGFALTCAKLQGEVDPSTSIGAATSIAEQLTQANPGREKEVLVTVIEKLLGTHLSAQGVKTFSLLSSRLGHTTIQCEDPSAHPRAIAQEISNSLNIDASTVLCSDVTNTSKGVLFDLTDDIAALVSSAIEDGRLQGFAIPQRLPPEMFQRTFGGGSAGFGNSSGGRGGYGGGRGGYGGGRGGGRGGFGGGRGGYGGDRGGDRGGYGGDRGSFGGSRGGRGGFSGDRGGRGGFSSNRPARNWDY